MHLILIIPPCVLTLASLIAVLRDSSFVDVGQRDRTGIGVHMYLVICITECAHGLYVYSSMHFVLCFYYSHCA